MYWQLGDIVFEKQNGFESFEIKTESEIAEHSLIQGKPRLQSTGQKANEGTISIHIHSYFADPKKQYDKLEKYRGDLSVLALIGGDGTVYGDFIIKSLDLKINQVTPDGKWVDITCEVDLLENYWSDARKKAEQEAKDGAFASISNVPPLASGTIPIQGVNGNIMQDLQKVNNQATSASSLIDKAKKYGDEANGWVNKASQKINEYQGTLAGLQNKLQNALSLGSTATNLLNQISGLQSVSTSLINALNLHDLLTASQLNQQWQQLSGTFISGGAPISGLITLRS